MDTYRHFQSRPEERSDPFANAIFNCIVSKSGGVWLEFYHRSFLWVQMTDSKISIVQIMVWARTEERSLSESILTPPPLVPHICVREMSQHWFRWLSESMLEYCTLVNKLQLNSIEIKKYSIHENAFENVVCKIATNCPRHTLGTTCFTKM